MKVLIDFPSIVKKYSKYYESCCSPEGFEHFKKAISGFIVSENKTLEAINRLFVSKPRNQSSFNRFFNRQHFDLVQINECRLSMLQENEQTRLKPDIQQAGGAISIDNTLLTHYGKCFDHIYNLYDSTAKRYSLAHDLVTLHYSDEQTDYPVYYQLWEPPDWERVALFLKEQGFPIRQDKWDKRLEEPQKWRNYIRSRYKLGRKKHPEVVDVYRTKLHIAEGLLRKFCNTYPQLNYPVVLDAGFTWNFVKLLYRILKEIMLATCGAIKKIILSGQEELLLSEFTERLKAEHFDPNEAPVFQKTGYTFKGQKKYYYTYVANHRIKNFENKQRLVIAFSKEELAGTPYFVITNRLNWYPSGILRLRRQRWPVETYHQEGKAEGLDKYQVRNFKAIQTYIGLCCRNLFDITMYYLRRCALVQYSTATPKRRRTARYLFYAGSCKLKGL